MSELVVALDIGTTKVCTLVAEVQTGGAVKLLGVSYDFWSLALFVGLALALLQAARRPAH